MKEYIFPKKLTVGDEVRVIAPSFSMAKWPKEIRNLAQKRFEEMGLKVTFGKHVMEIDDFESSSIQLRVEDLMDAFSDKKVKGIICGVGGYNANFLLDDIDWKTIRNNPKFFCGMSDITVLNNAILHKTGLVTYSGPNFRNFGQKLYFDYTWDFFKRIVFSTDVAEIEQSDKWSDDKWIKNQTNRKLIKNDGWWCINEGRAGGIVVGGNLCSLNLLQGTEYMPDLKGALLMIEDDSMSTVGEFSRNWRSLMHLSDFKHVSGIIFGRFQKKTKMTRKLLTELIKDFSQLDNLPVIGNVDFGHTDPKITFPIGGVVEMKSNLGSCSIKIVRH